MHVCARDYERARACVSVFVYVCMRARDYKRARACVLVCLCMCV